MSGQSRVNRAGYTGFVPQSAMQNSAVERQESSQLELPRQVEGWRFTQISQLEGLKVRNRNVRRMLTNIKKCRHLCLKICFPCMLLGAGNKLFLVA